MSYLVLKYLVTAGIVVIVSEVARRSDRLGALISSLPLVTILTLIWLHFEKQSDSKIANHAYYTFWYVIPTLPMFILFPFAYSRWGFWIALASCISLTLIIFLVAGLILKRFGISLL